MTRRGPPLAAVLLAVALAACGSTNNGGTTTNASSQLALAQCMRSHGATNFPDPGVGGGFAVVATPGSSAVTVDGTRFGGPAFEAAVKACKLFGGRTAPPPLSAAQKRQSLAFARCMRTQGVPVPDPTFPASGGIAGKPPPGLNRSSPAFQKAAQACGQGAR